MAATRVLLLGGHGKIAMKLTPMLTAKSWDVTSVVRNKDQESEIKSLGNGPGKIDVLVDSLDDVISYIASRKGYPKWWNDDDKKAADKVGMASKY